MSAADKTKMDGIGTFGFTPSATDGLEITHGRGTTPTWVILTATVAGTVATVTAKGSTTFTIALKKYVHGEPLTLGAGDTQTVYWICG